MIYLNGEFVAYQDAKISAFDRGCLFGDGVYEVIPVYSRRPFRLAEHVTRLEASLAAIGLDNPHPADEWIRLIEAVIAQQTFDDQSVYLHVTRGAAGYRDFPFPQPTQPTVLIFSTELVTPDAAQKAAGVRALSHADFRWLRCDIKSLNLLPTVLMREHARRAGCTEVVLFRDGWLSEGAASNIFVVKDGVVLAPPKSQLMLPGITYDLVLELCVAHGVAHAVRPIAEPEVREADELWMTSSTKEILPIVELDGQAVGAGRPGPLAAQLDTLYQDFKARIMRQGLQS
ncbi:D-amino acid aminotransferase [Chitinimonas lacunae]|uniref:D-amino acid aminotransferase n=1 Tax=Chitinimonas lacunae TaxID=1963018 RepID=A0ABV8MQS1_9NEIS